MHRWHEETSDNCTILEMCLKGIQNSTSDTLARRLDLGLLKVQSSYLCRRRGLVHIFVRSTPLETGEAQRNSPAIATDDIIGSRVTRT